MKREVDVSMKVNGAPVSVTVEARTLLVQLLRDQLGLTGTKIGCDTSTCGACTVLLDGRSAKSCTLLAAQVSGATITTIEGLASDDERLSALQEAFHQHHALQCGYCTPGMIMAATSLLDELGDAPTDPQIRTGLKGNLCRCTGYQHIIDAIQAAARSRSAAAPHQGVGPEAEAEPGARAAWPRERGAPRPGAGPDAAGSVPGTGASGEEGAR